MSLLPPTHWSILLMLQADADDADAWRRFLGCYRPAILQWCERKGLQHSSAEDLTQSVLLKLYRSLHTFDASQGHFHTWLQRVLQNALCDYWRAAPGSDLIGQGGTTAQERLVQQEDEQVAEDLASSLEIYQDPRLQEALERVKTRVDPATWEVCCRVLIEGRPAQDVAQELGMRIGAVHQAKYRLTKILLQEYQIGQDAG